MFWRNSIKKTAQYICSLCHHQLADQEAVVILEKTPIREDTLAEIFSSSRLMLEMKNDIYSTYRLQAPPQLNGTVTGRYTDFMFCESSKRDMR